jgi:hypothetical protein
MEKLHSLVKEASYIIDAESFEVNHNFHKVDGSFTLQNITIYFKDSNIDKFHSLTFSSEEKAIEGITGFIQLYNNID